MKNIIIDRFSILQLIGALNDFETISRSVYLYLGSVVNIAEAVRLKFYGQQKVNGLNALNTERLHHHTNNKDETY